MKPFAWNEGKNQQLKFERGISFDQIKIAMNGNLLDIILHPNQKKYPGQRMYIVAIDSYAYVVPFVEDEEKIFLKTIYPSRAATKKYLINR